MTDYENNVNEEGKNETETVSNFTEGTSCNGGNCGCDGDSCGCLDKKCKLPLIAGLILLVAILVGGGYFFYQKVFGNPLNQLLLGVADFYKEKEINSITDVSFAMTEDSKDLKTALSGFSQLGVESSDEELYAFLAAVVPNFKIKYATGASVEPDKLNAGISLDVLYKDKSLVDILYHVRPWELRLASDKALSKPIYIDLAKLVKALSGGMTDLSKLELKGYLEILTEKDEFIEGFKDSEYIKIIREVLQDKVTKEGSKIVLTMSNKENVDLVKRFLAVAKTDERLKKSVVTKVTKLLDHAKERKDYELFGMPEATFNNLSSMAKVQIETSFEIGLSEIEKVYSSPEYLQAMDQMDDVAVKYVFTMSGKKIVAVDSSANIGGILVKSHTEYGKKAEKISEVAGKSGAAVVDLSNVQEDPLSAISFASETLSNIDKQVLKGEAFKMFSEDVKTVAKEKLATTDAAKIVSFFDDVVPNLVNNGLKTIMGGGF